MRYAISVFHQDGEKRAKLTLVTPKYEFALVLPYGDLRMLMVGCNSSIWVAKRYCDAR